jgi:cyanophycin synthetase
MRVMRMRAMAGPNIWSRGPALEIWFEQADAHPTNGSLPDARERVLAWRRDAGIDVVPYRREELIARAHCDINGSAAFGQRSPVSRSLGAGRDRSLCVFFAELAQALQSLAGTAVSRFWIEDHLVALEFFEEPIARLAAKLAHQIVWGEEDDLPDAARSIEALRECANEACFGATTGPVVEAARARGIPVMRLDGDCLVQFGHGSRQKRIQGVVTSHSGFIAEAVSRDKLLTKRLFAALRLPTARGRLASDPDDAWAAAGEIGLPVVIKPRDADYANGVSVRLTTKAEVAEAWTLARAVRSEVLVEQHLAGVPHRLFIVSGRMVGAARRDPARVVGDGKQNVAELIAAANRDPRRGDGPDSPWHPIEIDEPLRVALEREGLGLGSVPEAGRCVALQNRPRNCRAETVRDVTDLVHPDVAAAAIAAVHVTGLDVAGVDVMAEDIARPLDEQGGGILEVNAGPAIYLHRRPACSPERPVVEAVVDSLIPPGETGCIPIVAVVGGHAAAVAGEIANVMQSSGLRLGLATREGIRVDGRTLSRQPADNVGGCRALLLNPDVDAAVCELSLASLREEGLAFDRCDLVVLAGVDSLRPPDEPRGCERCLRLLMESVPDRNAVITAGDSTSPQPVILQDALSERLLNRYARFGERGT